MKKAVLLVVSFFCMSDVYSQNLEAYLSFDSRTGYSTNTYLHPFINEWDQTDSGAFSRLSPSAEMYLYRGRFTAEISGGYFFEPTFDNRQDWTGMFSSARFNYRLTNHLSAEVQASGSRLSSVYDRQSFSVLPALTWSPSLFTRINARTGTSFRRYNDLIIEGENGLEQTSDRYNIYGLEIERWASLKWQIRGSIYGLMDQNLFENHSLSIALSRVIRQTSGISLNLSLNRYQNSLAIDSEGGIIPAGTPVNDDETQFEEESDMLFRSGLSFSFPIMGNLSGNGSISHLLFMPAATEGRSDAEFSVGVRYRWSASTIFQQSKDELSPDWQSRKDNSVIVKIRYRGEGELFLVGEFNDWERPGVRLSRQTQGSGRYAVQLELEPGIYEYKILLLKDGEENWIELSDDTMTVSDGFGGTNGLIFID